MPNAPSVDDDIFRCLPSALLEAIAFGAEASPTGAAHLARCPRCTATLAAIRADHDLLANLAVAARGPQGTGTGDPVIPGYDLGPEITRGGQGVVRRGIQRATHRPVAIKILLDGRLATSRQRRRFEREIELIGGIRHPGIVTLHDGGTTDDGHSWFAMELIDGQRLDEWARQPARALGDRLRVFRAIVDAIVAAHRHGVIHRDLKPGNVLVDGDGEPRVLDFGLARPDLGSADDRTLEEGFTGTLLYAAPEQFDPRHGAVDARTDIHALGLILYELIVGKRPFADRSVTDAIRLRTGAAPPNAPLRAAGADADLAAIVRRAADPDPAARYQSAAALADDLERHRTGRPVAARGDATLYLLWRLARRHALIVSLAVAMVTLLIAATIVSSILLVQREHARRRSQDTLSALTGALLAVDPLAAPGGSQTASEYFDTVSSHLDRRLAGDPDADAAVRQVLGGIALNLADLDAAEAHCSRVLEWHRSKRASDGLAIAQAEHDLARVRFFRGDYVAAELLYRDSLARRRARLGPHHPLLATSLSHLASCRRRLGDLDEAESLSRAALAIRFVVGDTETIAAGLNNLGSLLREREDLDGAARHYADAITMLTATAETDDWRVAHALGNLASVRIDRGEFARATIDLDRAEGILRDRLADSHPKRVALALERVRMLHASGAIEEADAALERAIADAGGTVPMHAEALEAWLRLVEDAEAAGDVDRATRLRTLGARPPGAAPPDASPTDAGPTDTGIVE